jgi:hypothetical protein
VALLFAVAHFVTWELGAAVYGGFCRDVLVAGFDHNTLDLDVAVSPTILFLSVTTSSTRY